MPTLRWRADYRTATGSSSEFQMDICTGDQSSSAMSLYKRSCYQAKEKAKDVEERFLKAHFKSAACGVSKI
jgi:chemotaxis methyl-accepting protein methylase